MTEAIYATLGADVRERRETLHMTQAELAALIGLSRASVANIEAGRQAVLLHQFLLLAQALNTNPADLMPSGKQTAAARESRDDLPAAVSTFLESVGRPRGLARRSTR